MTETEEKAIELGSITEELMAGEMMAMIIDELKQAPCVWQQMSEHDQQDVIYRAERRVKSIITQAVHILASKDRPALIGDVDTVTFKDGVKAVLKMDKASPHRHDLADAEGSSVILVVVDPDEYFGGVDEVEAEPNQASLV